MLLICFSNVIILAMEDGMLATYLSLPGRCLLPCTPQANPVGELRALGIVHCGFSEKGVEVFVFINELCFVEKVFNNHWYSMERELFVLNLGHLIDVATGVKGKSTKCPRSGIV